jgi:hypothetical protein
MSRICKDCEKPLSDALLEAKPYAEFCSPCRSKHDKHSEPKSQGNAEYLTRSKKLKTERTKKTKEERRADRINQSLKDGGIG